MNNGVATSDCPVYVLAGGHSKRFGSDKSRVLIEGRSQIERLTETFLSQGHEVTVVASEQDGFHDLGFSQRVRVIADHEPDLGPMMGVATSLIDRLQMLRQTGAWTDESLDSELPSRRGWLLVCSVDQYLWKRRWFETLAAEVENTVETVTFCCDANAESTGPGKLRTQPLPGLYHVCLLPKLEQALSQGRLALRSVVEAADGIRVTAQDDNPSKWSFNDQATLQRLIRRDSETSEP